MTLDFALLKRIVEAALLAAGQPLSIAQLAALFGEHEPVGHDELARVLAELQQDCTGRGVELKEVASGFRYQIREDVHPWVSRLWTERQTKYSRALLETLALIAYRQPITRAEIEQIRGVAVSSSIVKTLEEREWVRVVGYRDVPGKPALFGTTRLFLDYFNLKSLDELPPLADIRDLDDFDPQLTLGPIAADGPAHEASGEAPAERDDDSAAPASAAAGEEASDPAPDAIVSADEADGSRDLPASDGPLSHPDETDAVATAVDPPAATTASADAPEHTA